MAHGARFGLAGLMLGALLLSGCPFEDWLKNGGWPGIGGGGSGGGADEDAGTDEPEVCDLLCVKGSVCEVTAHGPKCKPVLPSFPSCDPPCEKGTHCELQEIVCITTPCDPIAECVEDPSPCDTVRCAAGTHCEDDTGHASCVPDDPAPTCALVDCPDNTYCDDISGEPVCLPLPSCDTVKCSAGYHCELGTVQCIRAPCPPQPRCVKGISPCAVALCPGRCSVLDGKVSCSPLGPPSVPCGKSTCSGGNVCCNASCGICTPPDGACIQIACE